MFRKIWPLLAAFALLIVGIPLLALADWGSPPEPRGRVLASPDGVVISATNPLPVGQRLPTAGAPVAVDPNQDEAAPDFAADPTRVLFCCQANGTTTARASYGVNTAGGTRGFILAPGAAGDDGRGAGWCSPVPSMAQYLYDVTGAGNADLDCEVATW